MHDLEAVRDPCDARQQRGIVHAGRGRSGEPEHDLRLDLGLGIGRERQRHGQIVQRAVVDIAPVRRAHAVFVPHPAIGETGLAADRLVALGDAQFVCERRHAIGVVQGEVWIARGE